MRTLDEIVRDVALLSKPDVIIGARTALDIRAACEEHAANVARSAAASAVVVAKPGFGDTLFVILADRLPQAEKARLREEVRQSVRAGVGVVILDGVRGGVVVSGNEHPDE